MSLFRFLRIDSSLLRMLVLSTWATSCGTSSLEDESQLKAATNPRVASCLPGNGAAPDSSISCTLGLIGSGVNATTLTASTVKLTLNGAAISCKPGTSGGRDSITCTPTRYLEATRTYVFEVTNGVKDEQGRSFLPFRMQFTTGTANEIRTSPYNFARKQVYTGQDFCFSMDVGPDGRLYCAAPGKIIRWNLNADGSFGTRETYAPAWLTEAGGPRAIVGLAFKVKGELWISHSAPLTENARDFSGGITRLTWAPDGAFNNTAVKSKAHVSGLPRSARDHLTNSLTVKGDYLYVTQGSNTAMGQPQNDSWGNRPERLLSAAILRIDTRGNGSVDVRTRDGGGTYDPYAPGARVTLFATGVRNAYDLLWHSNGQLYTATNGSSGGGSAPGCKGAPALWNGPTQNDYLFRINQGGYYGHPNRSRNECVLNRGNRRNHINGGDVVKENGYNGYPLGQQPDPNYRGFIYSFGRHKSPNGMLEYNHGALAKSIFVTRWSAGDDVLILPAPTSGAVDAAAVRVLACGGRFENPIDITEDLGRATKNGNLYVSEMVPAGQFYSGRIQLCKPQF